MSVSASEQQMASISQNGLEQLNEELETLSAEAGAIEAQIAVNLGALLAAA